MTITKYYSTAKASLILLLIPFEINYLNHQWD